MTLIHGTEFSFSETINTGEDDKYYLAWGWTESTGQSGTFKISAPSGWEYDPRYPDERPTDMNKHGGCPYCIMTLVHFRKLKPSLPTIPEIPILPNIHELFKRYWWMIAVIILLLIIFFMKG